MADKVSEKAGEISKDVAKSTENLKQASLSTPDVTPDLESVGLGPDKVPSGPYSFREVFSFTGLAPEVGLSDPITWLGSFHVKSEWGTKWNFD